jgi:two-component system response regulator AtoC
MQYSWPGNVRELENVVKRLVVLGTEAQVRRELALGPPLGHPPARESAAAAPIEAAPPEPGEGDAPAGPAGIHRRSLKEVSREAAREAETKLILSTLERTRWNRKQAAHLLGISYKALLYKIKDSGMDQAVVQ